MMPTKATPRTDDFRQELARVFNDPTFNLHQSPTQAGLRALAAPFGLTFIDALEIYEDLAPPASPPVAGI